MNILLNSYCNLSCSYCFAKQMLNDPLKPEDMSFEDFEYCLEFLYKSKINQIRLLGGEPTLSRNFSGYCDIIENKKDKFKEVLIFSNGIIKPDSMERILNLNKKIKTRLLLNTNPPSVIGKNFEALESNIRKLKDGRLSICLGINIDSENFEYDYFLELVDKYRIRVVRWVLTSPDMKQYKEKGPIEFYRKNIDTVLGFLEQCFKRNIRLYGDCNVIPLCAFNDYQLRKMAVYDPLFLVKKRCEPVVDVMPDLSAARCLGTSHHTLCNIKDFEDRSKLAEYFVRTIDSKINGKAYSESCSQCELHDKNLCGGGCLAFSLCS